MGRYKPLYGSRWEYFLSEMSEAMHNFKKKFKVESKKEYIDLNDFSWFSLYNKK